jgi:hypothetical protein
LREAHEALPREVELARRRLVVAKAERVDTTQLELEFAAKLAALDALAGQVDGEADGDAPEPERDKSKKKLPSTSPDSAGGGGESRSLRVVGRGARIGELEVQLQPPETLL